MNWLSLFLAGILEIVWAIGLKQSEGFTKLVPSAWTLMAMIGSFVLLASAMRTLPMGTAYAVWVGIGAVGTVIAGMVWFSEPKDLIRIAFVLLIVVGIVGLKLTASGAKAV